jgi:hypothetical protein
MDAGYCSSCFPSLVTRRETPPLVSTLANSSPPVRVSTTRPSAWSMIEIVAFGFVISGESKYPLAVVLGGSIFVINSPLSERHPSNSALFGYRIIKGDPFQGHFWRGVTTHAISSRAR